MKQLDVVKHLESVFGRRHLRRYTGKRGITTYSETNRKIFVVKDLAASRQVLTSRAFESFNYFEDGYSHFARSKTNLDLIRSHFCGSPLFSEGERHRTAKQAFTELLTRQSDELERNAPAIKAYIHERKDGLNSANDFAHAFVEICLAIIISNLSSLPLEVSLSALRARQNVFHFHFHPRRHKDANEALGILERSPLRPGEVSAPNYQLLLCQSILLMAYDPLVATICASIIEGRTEDLAANANLYCATSFVSRICVEPTTIGPHSFQKGDVSYVSLVPASDESVDNTLPFGIGRHVCVGKRISIHMLDMATQIIASEFKEGFGNDPTLSPDGAFLFFRD